MHTAGDTSENAVEVVDEPLHRILYRDETFSVFRPYFLPGERSLWHKHIKETVYLFLSDHELDITKDETTIRKTMTGGTFWICNHNKHPLTHQVLCPADGKNAALIVGVQREGRELDENVEIGKWVGSGFHLPPFVERLPADQVTPTENFKLFAFVWRLPTGTAQTLKVPFPAVFIVLKTAAMCIQVETARDGVPPPPGLEGEGVPPADDVSGPSGTRRIYFAGHFWVCPNSSCMKTTPREPVEIAIIVAA